jgi:hypothetical protein
VGLGNGDTVEADVLPGQLFNTFSLAFDSHHDGLTFGPLERTDSGSLLVKEQDEAIQNVHRLRAEGDENPVFRLQLSDLDVEPLLGAVGEQDSLGARRFWTKRQLWSHLGVRDTENFVCEKDDAARVNRLRRNGVTASTVVRLPHLPHHRGPRSRAGCSRPVPAGVGPARRQAGTARRLKRGVHITCIATRLVLAAAVPAAASPRSPPAYSPPTDGLAVHSRRPPAHTRHAFAHEVEGPAGGSPSALRGRDVRDEADIDGREQEVDEPAAVRDVVPARRCRTSRPRPR